jgi:hypothetical protein
MATVVKLPEREDKVFLVMINGFVVSTLDDKAESKNCNDALQSYDNLLQSSDGTEAISIVQIYNGSITNYLRKLPKRK